MHSREQYLEKLREEYRRASKKQKTRLLNEARKRTQLARKVLIRKLSHPAKLKQPKARRGASYGAEVLTTLVEVWELFDFACGQRLVAALRTEVPRMRAAGQLKCSDEVGSKLGKISASARATPFDDVIPKPQVSVPGQAMMSSTSSAPGSPRFASQRR